MSASFSQSRRQPLPQEPDVLGKLGWSLVRPDHDPDPESAPSAALVAPAGAIDPPPAGPPLPPGISLDATLSQLYELYVFPACRRGKAAEGTILQDRETLSLWAALTGDPPLRQIDQLLCAAFVGGLEARPGKRAEHVSPNTVRKHCTHLQFILDRAGPRTRRNRLGLGLFHEDPPYFERPKKRSKPPRDSFTLDEIARLLEACPAARATMNLLGIDAPTWWHSIWTFAYNTGLRIDTIMLATRPMVDREEEGWLSIPAEIYKGGQHGHEIYLNGPARGAIEAVACCVAQLDLPEPYRSRLFPWARWPESASWLHSRRRAIQAQSSLPPHRRFGFHAFRKALLTWAGTENKELSRAIAGHEPRDITSECYINLEDPEARRKLRDLLNRVPQPGRLRQRELF